MRFPHRIGVLVLIYYTVYDAIFDPIPEIHRHEVLKMLVNSDATRAQRRPLLAKKGLSRLQIDVLDVLSDAGKVDLCYYPLNVRLMSSTAEDVDVLLSRLDKVAPQLVLDIRDAVDEVRKTIEFTISTGVARPVMFSPLFMMKNPSQYFKGICFEVVKRQQKRPDVLAVGGRSVDTTVHCCVLLLITGLRSTVMII